VLGLSLIVVSSAWLVIAAVLVLEVTGLRRRGRHVRWQAGGLLLLMSAAVADAFTAQRGWPPAPLRAVHMAGLGVAAAGGLIFLRGLRRPARDPARRPARDPARRGDADAL
jgi:hypothetical protein